MSAIPFFSKRSFRSFPEPVPLGNVAVAVCFPLSGFPSDLGMHSSCPFRRVDAVVRIRDQILRTQCIILELPAYSIPQLKAYIQRPSLCPTGWLMIL
eukprot:17583_1